MKPRLKNKLLPNNMKFCHISDSNNNFELSQYWHNSLNSSNNKYSNFSKEEKGEKR